MIQRHTIISLLCLSFLSSCIFVWEEKELPPIFAQQINAPSLEYVWPKSSKLWLARIKSDQLQRNTYGSGPTFKSIGYVVVEDHVCIKGIKAGVFDYDKNDCPGEDRLLSTYEEIKVLGAHSLKLVGAYEIAFHAPLQSFEFLCLDILETPDGVRVATVRPQNISVQVVSTGEVVSIHQASPYINSLYCPNRYKSGRGISWRPQK